jgi:hypothetical protein
VEVLGLGFFQRNINGNVVSPLLHIPSLDLAVFWGDDHGSRTGIIQRLSWFKQFGLFESVGRQDRNSDAARLSFVISCSPYEYRL